MRVVQPKQPELGDLCIAEIWIDLKSRDDIPQILELPNTVFQLLERHIQPDKPGKRASGHALVKEKKKVTIQHKNTK